MQSFSQGCFCFFTTWRLPPARARDPGASEEVCLCDLISVLISNITHHCFCRTLFFQYRWLLFTERESELAF